MKIRMRIDGRDHLVEDGRDLLSTCLAEGIDVPHFCWHGAMGSVGACRLCAVRVHAGPDDTTGHLDMACMVPVAEGLRVSIDDPEAEAFRARVIEWLMINHPHDCAVCEEAGSCHLQDMTVLTGHHKRRYRYPKRTHRNQDLGPLLTHEMNRCIGCYRCTRFYRGYAGGRDLDVFGAHDRIWFGRAEDGPLDSPFAGNLAEVCPTGVFNDKAWSQSYARKWDMMATPAICTHCAVGCNQVLAERHERLRRVQNRYHGAINGYFLCDRGRFGPLFVDSDAVLVEPTVAGQPVDSAAAAEAARAAIARGAIGIGSPRAALESNYALARLVGADRFFAGVMGAEVDAVGRMLALLRAGPARIAPLKDLEAADAALILGEDLTGTAPRAALSVRQAARNAARALAAHKGIPAWLDSAVRNAGEGRLTPIAVVTPLPDALDPVASWPLRRPAAEIADFGTAVAAALRGEPAGPDAQAIATALAAADRPAVVAGFGTGDPAIVAAAGAIASALGPKASLTLIPPEANSLGLALLGGDGLEAAVTVLESGAATTALVVENDLAERGDPALIDRLFAAAKTVIVLDTLQTRTTARAAITLPVASMAEAAGTFVNHEGRAQRSFAALPAGPPAAWRRLAALAPVDWGWRVLDDVLAALAADRPPLAGAVDAAPGGGFTTPLGTIARGPRPLSGRTAHDVAGRIAAGRQDDPDSALTFSMEGAHGDAVPPALLAGYESPYLHSASGVHHAQDAPGGGVRGGDPGVRLIEPGAGSGSGEAVATPVLGEGLVLIPLHDPWTGTETARAATRLRERAPAPALRLHPADAAGLGLAAGAPVRLDGRPCAAPVTLDPTVPPGHVAASLGTIVNRGALRRVRVEAAS